MIKWFLIRENNSNNSREKQMNPVVAMRQVFPSNLQYCRKTNLTLFSIFWIVAVKQSSDAKSVSQSIKSDSMHIIRLENLPWIATKKNIVYPFTGINILDGENGVHFIVGNAISRTEAFIQLASHNDYQMAMKRKQLRLFNFLVNSA